MSATWSHKTDTAVSFVFVTMMICLTIYMNVCDVIILISYMLYYGVVKTD